MQHPIIFFLLGIMCFVWAYLSFMEKLSIRWRSGYFYAPEDEKNSPGFKANSKLRSCVYFLFGVAAILFGFYLLSHKEWMQSAAIAIALLTVISSTINGAISLLVQGIKHGKRKKRHLSLKQRKKPQLKPQKLN